MSLRVGAGLIQHMNENQDHPLTDSKFTTNGDGTIVETCIGTKGLYISSNANGDWENAGPLAIVQA